MLLGLEEGVKVPEAALHIVVGGHLGEAHLQEDLAVLGPHLEQSHIEAFLKLLVLFPLGFLVQKVT